MRCLGSPVMWLATVKLYNYTAVAQLLADPIRTPLSCKLLTVSGSVSPASLWPVAHFSGALTNGKEPFCPLFVYTDCKKELCEVYQIDRECFTVPNVVQQWHPQLTLLK